MKKIKLGKMPKKTGRWIIIAIISTFLFFFLSGNDGMIALFQAHLENKKLESKIIEYKKTIDSLEVTIVKLKTDTAYIERIAREKLGMAGKDEKVYKFVE